jgi:SAM-dependent methyltransferase
MIDEGPLAHVREHREIAAADVRIVMGLFGAATGTRILDVGAGRGIFVEEARVAGLAVVATDLEPAAGPVWRSRGITGVVADAFAPPFKEASFDVVRLKEVIEHVADPRALVAASMLLLRPGGYFIAHVPSPYSQWYPVGNFWDDYTHVRPFSRQGLRRLMEDSGLGEIRIDAYVAGRNALERGIGRLLRRVLPHTYRVVARKPERR